MSGRPAVCALASAATARPVDAGTSAARPILVTGGAGFLGSNLADRLAGQGRRVLVLDSLARPGVAANLAWLAARHGERVTHLAADIRDAAALREAVRGVAAVLHLAAQVAVTTSIADPIEDFEVNARGTLGLLEALRRQGGNVPLLFASTNKVYGRLLDETALERAATRWQPKDEARRQGCDERTPLDFHSPYGCSKGVADQYVLDYARVFGLPMLVFRMSCLYGPRQLGTEDQGWVAHFLIQALEGRPITIFGDGGQVRDVLYVDDAIDAWLAGLARIEGLKGRVLNLGGGPASTASLLEMLAMIEDLTGTRPVVRHREWRPGDQLWYVSDTRALAASTGWRARVGIADGLARLHAWLLEHRRDRSAGPVHRPKKAVA